MRDVPTKMEYGLLEAETAAKRSKDPRTQVGAAVFNPDGRVVAKGYNGMPQGFDETSECWSDECKDDLVIHAELNAIANAARSGASTLDGTMFVTLPPCLSCARAIVAAGIRHVVFPRAAYVDWVTRKPIWRERFAQALAYLDRSHITWEMI